MNPSRWRELWDELRAVAPGLGGAAELFAPTLIFFSVDALAPLGAAVGASAAVGAGLALRRQRRGEPLVYTLIGLGGALLAGLFAWLSGTAAGYFLPDILQSVLTGAACLVSALVKKPLVALTSRLTRGWPAGWYTHARVLPAYQEVTLAWAAFFMLRAGLQTALLQIESSGLLLAANLLSGWPVTVLLLAGSYLYGVQRLRTLKGPSVAEFREQKTPPWTGQQRGF